MNPTNTPEPKAGIRNPELETLDCIDARMVELELLEQALNEGRDLKCFVEWRLKDLVERRKALDGKPCNCEHCVAESKKGLKPLKPIKQIGTNGYSDINGNPVEQPHPTTSQDSDGDVLKNALDEHAKTYARGAARYMNNELTEYERNELFHESDLKTLAAIQGYANGKLKAHTDTHVCRKKPTPNPYRHNHVCITCSPDGINPGVGCINCRNTGMEQMPCLLFDKCPGPKDMTQLPPQREGEQP